MRWRWLLIAIATLLLPAPLAAQVIQQPTFDTFSASTSVLAPTGGGGFMAGLGGSSAGSNRRGAPWLGAAPFVGRPRRVAAGVASSAAGIHVKAVILDPQSLQDELQARRGKANTETHMSTAPAESVADIRRQQAAEAATAESEHRTLFEQGKKALAEGKPGVAKIYFQMVARRASGELREQALAELNDLAKPGPRVATKRE